MTLRPLRHAPRAGVRAMGTLARRAARAAALLPGRLQDQFARLAVAAWALLLCHPAWADLPTVVVPDDVETGDFLGLMRSSLRVGLNIIILALGALAFYKVAAGALTKWDEYRKGRIELADIKEYVIAGGLVLAVIVALLTAANTIL